MKILLDTHILLWALVDDVRLPKKARELIGDPFNEKFISIVSLWEVEIKHLSHPDKMPLSAKDLAAYCQQAGIREIPVAKRHIFALQSLKRSANAPIHKDPFDRIMICQAVEDGLEFLTHDKILKDYQLSCVIYCG